MKGPNPALARERYRRLAATYDRNIPLRKRLEETFRRRAIDALRLKPGDSVLDVGCGTGGSFSLLEDGIGTTGRLIGIDQSPEMLAKARERLERHGWRNVTLIEAPVQAVEAPVQADVILFCLTHDIMRSPEGLRNVLRYLKPDGRVVAAGMRRASWWIFPLNIVAWLIASPYLTTMDGVSRPWSHLADLVADLQIESVFLGFAYVAEGRWAPTIRQPVGAPGADRTEGTN